MNPLVLFVLLVGLCQADTNFFISPGSQADQLASGNNSAQYPVYQEHDSTLLSWNTNWTIISLLLYQNENSSYIRLMNFVENPPNSLTYNMTPPVDLAWNDVFFLTLWNENWVNEGGERFFSSSYFRINATNTSTTTTTTTTTTSSTPTPTSNSTTTSATTTPETAVGDNTSSGDLSSGAKAGLGVGLGLGIPFLALAGVALFYFRRRRQTAAWQREQQIQQHQPPPTSQYHQVSNSIPPQDLSNPSPFKLGGAYSPPIEADGTSSTAHMPTTTTTTTTTHHFPIQELPGDEARV